MLKYLVMVAVVVGFASAAAPQEADPSAQRTAMVATLAQQLFQAEQMQRALQAQLAQAQRSLADMIAKCGDPCKAKDALPEK